MKYLTILSLFLLTFALSARDVVLYECTVERPPEHEWVLNHGEIQMSAKAWPNGESGMTVNLIFPAHAKGWPSAKLYLPPELRDWRRAKTVRIEVFTPEGSGRFGLAIQSKKEKANLNLGHYLYQFVGGRHTIVLDLSEHKSYDLSAIEYIDFFVGTRETPYTLYVGEISMDVVDGEEELRERNAAAAVLRNALDWRLALLGADPALAAAKATLETELQIPENPTLEQLDILKKQSRAAFAKADLAYTQSLADAAAGISSFWCAPEEKILRNSYAFRAAPTTGEYEISAARGEGESAQIAVYALRGQKAVKAEFAGAPKTADGVVFPAECLRLSPMGYVETRDPRYATEYIGYWPDPILEYLSGESIAIEERCYQSWWLDVRVPHGQQPGIYRGTIRIATDAGEVSLPYALRVRSFELPDGSAYFSPTAFNIGGLKFFATPAERQRYWEATAQLLLDNRLDPYDLYLPPTYKPIVDNAKWYLARGARGCNLGYINAEITDEQVAAYVANYRALEEAGLADKATIYAYDENLPDKFEMIKRSLKKLRAALPGVPVYTTAFDATFGKDNGLDEVFDYWIPLNRTFNRNLPAVEEARARGEHIGWYVCVSPAPPAANLLLDQPGNAHRLLMGFLYQKYKPECFLYYNATVWTTYKNFKSTEKPGYISTPIEGGPLLGAPWFGESFYDAPGDGRLVYPGKAAPVPTQRLKLIRDGMDDDLYLQLLQKELADTDRVHSPAWRAAAEKELQIEPEIAVSINQWTENPALLREKRERIAKLLEE